MEPWRTLDKQPVLSTLPIQRGEVLAMNEKTAKLLRRYAAQTTQEYSALKREWNEMNRIERTRKRRQIKNELGR